MSDDELRPPPDDLDWLTTETVRDGPSVALIVGLFFVGVVLVVIALAVLAGGSP